MRLETPEHIARENAAALVVCRAWNVSAVRQGDLNHFAKVDWKFYRNEKLVGVGEIKCRDISLSTYPHIWLEVAKFEAILNDAIWNSSPGLWLVSFEHSHVIKWINILDCWAYPREMGGRTDRGLEEDLDEMICVPVYQMKRVK